MHSFRSHTAARRQQLPPSAPLSAHRPAAAAAPRSLPLAGASSMGAPAVVVRHDGFFRRDRLWRGAGLALPVFAARSRASVGCGEFLDLLPLINLADAAGMRLLQARDTRAHAHAHAQARSVGVERARWRWRAVGALHCRVL